VATILGDGAIAEEACRVTGGNPFLLAELARALERAEPGTAIEELQTRAVASSVSRRVRRISPAAAALADAVALFPAGAELSLAAEVAGVPESEAAQAADALITADVLAVRAGAVEFLHPLMRSAIYEDVGAFARRRGHAAAAAALKARGERPEEVAAHLLAGDPGGSREDFLILRAAAEEAIAAVAPRAAVRYLARALEEEAAEPEEERSLLLELGRWQRRIGDPGSLETLARALELGVGTREHVPAAIELAATAFSQADHRAVACTVAAVDGVDATADERLILDMLLAESLWADMQIEASVRLIDRLPRDLSGETPAQRVALGMAGAVHLIKCAPAAEVMGMLRRSVGDDGAAPTPLAGIDLGDPLQWMVVLGELDEAQAIAEERMEHARVRGDEALFAATQNAYGWVLTLRGDLKGGEAAYRLGLASPAVSPFMRAHIRANLLQTLIQYGRLDEADQELAILAGAGVAQIAHIARLRRAQIALGRGEFEAAVDPLEQAMQAQMRVVPDPHPNDVWVAADLVDALLGAGRPADALAVIEPLVTLSERVGATFGLGLHGSALARITGDPADHERAVDVLADSPYRWDEARARLEYGSALRRAGRRVQAREQLTRALAYFHRQGVHHLAGRAREELAVSGARLRAVEELSGAAALTPAESRIARLAADGMSNKQIAQHLFVTVGTVQTTLVHCYRKLGVSGRRELPDALGDIAA
jgi:DNA-binding CsgD family transcriptional regulator